MPYSKCPVCGEQFHLSVRGDPSRWYEQFAPGIAVGGLVALKCLGCWVELREGHVVKVRKQPNHAPAASLAKVGEKGAVVAVLHAPEGKLAFEVECVRSDGSTAWTETFAREELTYVPTSANA